MRYKGYTGRFTVDLDENVIRGRVIGIRDVVTFQGSTIAEAREEFAQSVDEYLDFCQKISRPPETPYSGRIKVRILPEEHRRLATMAEQSGLDLNTFIANHLLSTKPSQP